MSKKEENVIENEVVENVEVRETEVNGIKIAEEVVAKIAGIAARHCTSQSYQTAARLPYTGLGVISC